MTPLSPVLAALVLLLLHPLAVPAGEIQAYNPPVQAPPLDLLDLDGNRKPLSDYRGRVVLVSFWGTWCPPCVEEMPSIQRLQDRSTDRRFSVLAVNVSEGRNRVAAFVERNGIRFTVLLDSEADASHAWQVRVFPTSYLVDVSGGVRYRAVGPVDWESGEALEAVQGLLSEVAEK